MKILLIILIMIACAVFRIGSAEQSVCNPGDQSCGKEVHLKDINLKFDLNLGDIKVKQGGECQRQIPIPAPQPPSCANKILSEPYESRIFIDSYKMSLFNTDFLRCEVKNTNVVVDNEIDKVNLLEIHTDANKDWTFFSAPEEKCLTFEVKAPSNARIALANSIQTFDKIEVELGAESNSQVSIKRLGSNCANSQRISGLINEHSFNSFWISWTDDYVHVGRKNENLIAITDKKIDVKIRFIGLSTTRNSTGVWKILKPNCPGYYNAQQKEKLKYTEASCVKIENTCRIRKSAGTINKTQKELLDNLKTFTNAFHEKRNAGQLSLGFMKSLLSKVNHLNDQATIIQERLYNCKKDEPLCTESKRDNTFTTFTKQYEEFLYEINSEISNAERNSFKKFYDCGSNAYLGNDGICECHLGWIRANGICVLDTDMDGYPDKKVENCIDLQCRADNCPDFPNPSQRDYDNDGKGDACDSDADNDGIDNEIDNCVLKANKDQLDFDKDLVGDVCDNCILVSNADQRNTYQNLLGDECSSDVDRDGVLNLLLSGEKLESLDNCPFHPNQIQDDRDGDGIGDVCDNCLMKFNPEQGDENENLIGDTCENDEDNDDDGIPNSVDNCINEPNSNQLDTDNDGTGDVCDNDIDNDGIQNIYDNCLMVPNADQKKNINEKNGYVCEIDFDKDGQRDSSDICPRNWKISYVNFYDYQEVDLNPEDRQNRTKWSYNSDDKTFVQTVNSRPGLVLGYDAFGSVEFNGTFYVDTESDDDFIGFVFGYQNNRKFYIVQWKKASQTSNNAHHAKEGLQIRLVNSETGPGTELRNALWHGGNTIGQVKILWKDGKHLGWKHKTAYRWVLRHNIEKHSIHLRVYETGKIIINSGHVFDTNINGGRLGLFAFSQAKVNWADIKYRCLD